MAATEPGRCRFFVERKKRYCKMMVGKGKMFCGEHDTEGGNILHGQHDTEGVAAGSRRIVCPLDPKHTVNEDKLHKHLKKCNSREKPPPVYFVRNRNCGSADEDEEMQPEASLCERSRTDLEHLIDKLKTAAEGLLCEVDNCVLSHPVMEDELNDPKNGDSAHKHLRQQSSILGHLEKLGLLEGGRCFVEFGAGRGKLSHWIHRALKSCQNQDQDQNQDLQLLLVERSTTRFKVDGKHQEAGVHFERLQVDIQHLDLSQVPVLQHKQLPLVAVGKHLCGAATDLALRCLLDNPGSPPETQRPQKRLKGSEPVADIQPGPGPGQVLGLVVALCCHHRCEWRHYVGRGFFRERGLGAQEFHAFCRMSSWATCGLRPTNQDQSSQKDHDHEPAEGLRADSSFLSAAERLSIGQLCKRLIDAGRRDFLRLKGFSSNLFGYVEAGVTLENVLLTAVPHTSSSSTCPSTSSSS